MAANIFVTMLGNLQQLGFFQFLFPFLLILAIAYGVLRASLKEYLPKSAAALISIIMAFFVMNYSGNVGYQIALFFSNLFGMGLVVATGILVVVILLGLLGLGVRELTAEKPAMSTVAFGIAIIFIVFLIFVGALGGMTGIPGLGNISLGSDFWSIIFFVIILVLVLWLLTREKEEE